MSTLVADERFARRARSGRSLAGVGTLLRFNLRRDRLMIPLWVVLITMVILSMPAALESVYPTAADRAEIVTQIGTNSSLRSMYGPVFSDSIGGLVVWRFGVMAAVLAGIMSLLIVVRHTRDEEESGRQELLSSAVVGRRAPLTAALLTALVANLALALLTAGGLSSEGGTGALALGLGLGAVGMVFATLAAIVAQFTESARLARGLTGAFLGAAFVLRAAGDSGTADASSALTWISPLGWLENMRAYAGERWWTLLLLIGAALVQGVVAYELTGRRDVGMSFLPSRPGRAEGRMGTAGALAWRLQRGGLIGWGAALLVAGAVFGAMAEGAADLVAGSDQTKEIIQKMGGQEGITDAFLAAMAGMIGMIAALYVVGSVLRLHSEETSLRAEPLLAAPVGRVRWATGHLMVAFGGSVVLMVLAGAGLGLGYGKDLTSLIGACLVQVPAVWTLGAVAVLLHGLAPRLAPVAWGVAGLILLLGWVGPALQLPDAVLKISPFAHLPKMPGGDMTWTPVLVLTALAVVLTGAGLAALRRRDISS